MSLLTSPYFHQTSPSPPSSLSSSLSSLLPSANEEVSMGTTILALSYAGGVVLGADSRTSTGSYVANRISDKVTPVSSHIACCRSGSAADTQAVTDIVKYYLEAHELESGRKPLVRTAARLFRELCYGNKDRLQAGIIIGGFDELKGGQIFALPLGGSLVEQGYALGGSGSTYIYGLIDARYRPDMSREECEDLIKVAISHAMARDGSSGGVIRLVTIDANGTHRQFIPGNSLPYMAELEVTGKADITGTR